MASIHLRVARDGTFPVGWRAGTGAFGRQDKTGALHPGTPGPDGMVVFDLTLQVKSLDADPPVRMGDVAHGPPAARFLYQGGAEPQGGSRGAASFRSPRSRGTRHAPRHRQAYVAS